MAEFESNTTNAKTELVALCQRKAGKSMAKGDIVYTVERVGEEFQASVTLNCIGGEEYIGEPGATDKIAEQNAAHQALLDHADEIKEYQAHKRKAIEAAKDVRKRARTFDGGVFDPDYPDHSIRAKLHLAVQHILGREAENSDFHYDIAMLDTGYEATLTLLSIPEFEHHAWTSEVMPSKQCARLHAASKALETLLESPSCEGLDLSIADAPSGGKAAKGARYPTVPNGKTILPTSLGGKGASLSSGAFKGSGKVTGVGSVWSGKSASVTSPGGAPKVASAWNAGGGVKTVASTAYARLSPVGKGAVATGKGANVGKGPAGAQAGWGSGGSAAAAVSARGTVALAAAPRTPILAPSGAAAAARAAGYGTAAGAGGKPSGVKPPTPGNGCAVKGSAGKGVASAAAGGKGAAAGKGGVQPPASAGARPVKPGTLMPTPIAASGKGGPTAGKGERTRLPGGPFSGEIVKWAGEVGLIMPYSQINHLKASMREGMVRVMKKDLAPGVSELWVGAVVKFRAYAETGGLGAEQVQVTG